MITAIYHVAYSVADLDKSMHFYQAALGCKEYFRLNHEDGRLMLVYLQVGDSQGYIELFPGGAPRTEAEPKGLTGYKHLCLEVDDMDKTIAALARHGIKPDSGPLTGKDGNVQAWIRDPDGNRIELMKRIAK